MKNIKTYNEAIRWYKDGKLIPSNEPEPSIVKDWTIINYLSNYYILTSYEKIREAQSYEKKYNVINFYLFDSYHYDGTLAVKIPSKVELSQQIEIHNENDNFISVKLSELSEDILGRISNI